MKKLWFIQLSAILIAAVTTLCVLSGCRKIMESLSKPPPEGVELESYTIQMTGYKQTITVKASPQELVEIIVDEDKMPFNSPLIDVKLKKSDEDPLEVGTEFDFSVSALGISVRGRLIVIRRDEENIWMVWDNPNLIQIQRWELKPGKGETRVTYEGKVEIPQEGALAGLQSLSDFAGVLNQVRKLIDLSLARVQETYDPALDAEQMVAQGLRGDGYEELLQVYEARIWIDSSPEDVESWLSEPENLTIIFRGMVAEEDFLPTFDKAPPGRVVYFPTELKSRVKVNLDTFCMKTKESKVDSKRIYFVAMGIVGFMEKDLKPRAGGTLLIWKVTSEIPEAMSQGAMDLIFTMAEVPEWMKEMMVQVKTSVEAEAKI